MPKYTTHYNLKKPLQEEFYNIDDHNENMDIIDEQLKLLSEDSGVVISPDEPENGDVWIDIDDEEEEGGVASVNGQTGHVNLTAKDGDAYAKGETYTKTEVNELLNNKDDGEYVPITGGTMIGKLVAQSNTDYTSRQVRNIIFVPDGGDIPSTADGDIILFYIEE